MIETQTILLSSDKSVSVRFMEAQDCGLSRNAIEVCAEFLQDDMGEPVFHLLSEEVPRTRNLMLG